MSTYPTSFERDFELALRLAKALMRNVARAWPKGSVDPILEWQEKMIDRAITMSLARYVTKRWVSLHERVDPKMHVMADLLHQELIGVNGSMALAIDSQARDVVSIGDFDEDSFVPIPQWEDVPEEERSSWLKRRRLSARGLKLLAIFLKSLKDIVDKLPGWVKAALVMVTEACEHGADEADPAPPN
jgi:hypothetical protein